MANIIVKKGNIFDSECESIVCPVNCFGVMGTGLAKDFRESFDNEKYKSMAQTGVLSPGACYVHVPQVPGKLYNNGKTVIYLATKYSHLSPSKMEWIELCCANLLKSIFYYKIKSIAIPAIGCGSGNLPWPSVEAIMRSMFIGLDNDFTMEIYEPYPTKNQ